MTQKQLSENTLNAINKLMLAAEENQIINNLIKKNQKFSKHLKNPKKMENNDNEQILNNFLEYCKTDPEFIHIKTYANSVIVSYERSILTSTFKRLIDADLSFFVYRSLTIDDLYKKEENCICLFIYKKKEYVFS